MDPGDAAQWQKARFFSSLGWMIVLITWEGAAPFLREFSDHRTRLIHAGRNWVMGVINSLVIASCFSALWIAAVELGEERHWGLVRIVPLPPLVSGIVVILSFDLWTYWWHRLNHQIPLLWRFHRVHHSDRQMDVTTANRFHFGEIVLSSILRVPLILLTGASFGQLVVYETAMQFVVQLHHANVILPPKLEALLSRIITTPMIHKVHHSRVPEETDSNYSSLFSMWDRVFRSLRIAAHPSAIEFGLNGEDPKTADSTQDLLIAPFRKT